MESPALRIPKAPDIAAQADAPERLICERTETDILKPKSVGLRAPNIEKQI